MADVPHHSAIARRRRFSAWLIAPVLAGAAIAALLSGRQQVISALPLLAVAGFYFALYRGSTLHDRAAEPEAGAPAGPAVRLGHLGRSALAVLTPKRRADKPEAEAEHRREAARSGA